MSDERGQEPEEGGEEYEAPKAEELPEADTVGAASGPGTAQDVSQSDRNLKTEFAEVDAEAVLARVRQHPVDL